FAFETRRKRLTKLRVLHGRAQRFQRLYSAPAGGTAFQMVSEFGSLHRVQFAVEVGMEERAGVITGHGQHPSFQSEQAIAGAARAPWQGWTSRCQWASR